MSGRSRGQNLGSAERYSNIINITSYFDKESFIYPRQELPIDQEKAKSTLKDSFIAELLQSFYTYSVP